MSFVYFMRHGQTEYNYRNKWMGHTDLPLNEFGKEQVLASTNSLKKLGIKNIYSSPLKRATQTAELILPLLNIKNYFVLAGLAERNFGELEGKSKSTFAIEEINKNSTVENLDSFIHRIKDVLQEIEWHPSTLVISHSTVYKLIISQNICKSEQGKHHLGNAEFDKLYK